MVMCYYWTTIAKGLINVASDDIKDFGNCQSSICILTRSYIRDASYALNSSDDNSGNEDDANDCCSSEYATTIGDFENQPWIEFEGEYAADENLMKKLGLPVSWKHTKSYQPKKKEKIVARYHSDAEEEVYDQDVTDADFPPDDLESDWLKYWSRMGPELLLQNWKDPDVKNCGDHCAVDLENLTLSYQQSLFDEDDLLYYVQPPPSVFDSLLTFNEWKKHCKQQYWYYRTWFMDWCLNQCQTADNSCETQTVAETDCCADGESTASDTKTVEEKKFASSENTSQSGNNQSHMSHPSRPRENKDGDEPEDERIPVKLKKEHELDLDESPECLKISSVANNEYKDSFCEERDSNDECAENFDFSVVCKLMDYKFNSGSQKKRKKTKTTYLQKHFMKKLKRTHIRFDDDGNPLSVEESRVLPKVKQFLKAASRENLNQDSELLTDLCKSQSSLKTDDDDDDSIKENNDEKIESSFNVTTDNDEVCSSAVKTSSKKKRKVRNRKKNIATTSMPDEFVGKPQMKKFWAQRYRLFSKFDHGILMDEESWYSVTPEKIAEHVAERCACDVIVDGFCGSGGNSIQFAFTCESVIAIDIDPVKLNYARHNAAIYGVQDRIEFICGDFFQIAPKLAADVVFLSPPWGGPSYISKDVFHVDDLGQFGRKAFDIAREISPNIAFFLPRNTCVDELVEMAGRGNNVEVEQNLLNSKVKTVTAYYGHDLIEWGRVVEEKGIIPPSHYESDPKLSTFNESIHETPDYLVDEDCVENFG